MSPSQSCCHGSTDVVLDVAVIYVKVVGATKETFVSQLFILFGNPANSEVRRCFKFVTVIMDNKSLCFIVISNRTSSYFSGSNAKSSTAKYCFIIILIYNTSTVILNKTSLDL